MDNLDNHVTSLLNVNTSNKTLDTILQKLDSMEARLTRLENKTFGLELQVSMSQQMLQNQPSQDNTQNTNPIPGKNQITFFC
jgi:hypothetical protein